MKRFTSSANTTAGWATDEKAKAFFADVKIAKYTDKDGKEKVGHPYFLELVSKSEKNNLWSQPPTEPEKARRAQVLYIGKEGRSVE